MFIVIYNAYLYVVPTYMYNAVENYLNMQTHQQ